MELSSVKTKRKVINLLSKYKWDYQTSVFIDVSGYEHETAKELSLEWLNDFDDIKFRDYLRKTNESAILFIVRVGFNRNRLDRKFIKQIYLTLYSNTPLHLDGIPNRYLGSNFSSLNIMSRKLNQSKLASTVSAIKHQELHDISFLNDKKRYSLINKKLLIERTLE